MELRCEYKTSLRCPCVIRVEHVGDQVGVVVIRKRMGHNHPFDNDCSKTLPVKVKLVARRFAQGQSKVRAMAIWEALEEAGVNIESDFTMTKANKVKVMNNVRYQRKKFEVDMHKNQYGALYKFAVDHKVLFSELSELEDLHKFVVFEGWDVDVEKKNICIGFSTPHLLQNMCRGEHHLRRRHLPDDVAGQPHLRGRHGRLHPDVPPGRLLPPLRRKRTLTCSRSTSRRSTARPR